MTNYQVYDIQQDEEQINLLMDLGILSVKDNIECEELESTIEKFVSTNFKELYHELIDLVLVDIKTNKAVHRFNLVLELDELNNPIDQILHPFVDILESSFKYEFLQAYYNTYDEEF